MPVTIHDLAQWRDAGNRFVMVTAYDASFARILDEAGIPILLVGDSLAQTMLGYPTTLQVTNRDMVHHAAAVARGAKNALLIGDMPFGSYHASSAQAIDNAVELLRAGMHAVKLEGGGPSVAVVRDLVTRGIPVMGHLGLTPQHVNSFGGYRVQGRGDAGQALLRAAHDLADAGAFSIVLECIPEELAAQVTSEVGVPTIGIGAGPATNGQVMVLQDLLGMTPDPAPRFVKRYADLESDIGRAVKQYAKEVAEGIYPSEGESYH